MPPSITCAMAAPFTHTSAAPDVTITFASGTSPVTASLATGTYRMWLASSTTCYARALALACKLAIVAARGAGVAVAATMSAAGVVTITFTNDIPATITFAATVWQRLGFASASPSAVSAGAFTGARSVWHLATFVERVSPGWQPQTITASAEDVAGIGYGVTTGITVDVDDVAFGFIPNDPTARAALAVVQTAWDCDDAYLTSVATVAAREYSLRDFRRDAFCATVHYARGNWMTLLTSTSARYDVITLSGNDLSSPRVARLREGWDAYRRWTQKLTRQGATPTGTRA